MKNPFSSEEIAPNKLDKTLLALIKPYLTDSDPVLMCCENRGYKTFGYGPVGWHAELITKTRLIWANRHGGTVQTMKLADIFSVDARFIKPTSGLYHPYHVVAHSIGTDCDCSFYTQPLAQKFQQTLEQAIQQAKAKASPVSPEPSFSLEERLERLTRLHDAKLISDAEFEQKRKDILDEL